MYSFPSVPEISEELKDAAKYWIESFEDIAKQDIQNLCYLTDVLAHNEENPLDTDWYKVMDGANSDDLKHFLEENAEFKQKRRTESRPGKRNHRETVDIISDLDYEASGNNNGKHFARETKEILRDGGTIKNGGMRIYDLKETVSSTESYEASLGDKIVISRDSK